MKRYKIGLIGAGGVTELHLESCRQFPQRAEVAAICDPNAEALRARADRYGIPERFTDVADLIASGGIDAAIVCTPTSVRKEVVVPLLEAGIPLYVEKPLSDNFEEAAAIAAAAKRTGVPVCVNQNFRRFFTFELARDIIAEGTIGKVGAIHFNNLEFRQDAGWRLQLERHALSVMGIHWLDGFRRIAGSEAVAVHSRVFSSPAIECAGETDAAVQVFFANGVSAMYSQSFSSAFFRTDLIVIGETGTLYCDYSGVKLFRKDRREPLRSWAQDATKEAATFEGLENLFRWMETGAEAPNSVHDNVKTVALLDAAYMSAKERRIVSLREGLPS